MNDERENLPGASSWRRRELCAGSFQLEQEAKRLGQTPQEDRADADSGTRIHAALAGETVELSEKEAASVAFLRARGTEQAERIFPDQDCKTLVEERLWLDGKLSGRVDRVYYNEDTALVVDWKTGFTEPDPAETNAQLKVLAVLVALKLPTVKEVIVQIISGPYGVTEARYDIPRLAAAYNDIINTLNALNAPEAPLMPSPEACKYCKAILICQAVKNQVVTPVTKLQISELPKDGPRAAKLLDEVEILSNLLKEIKAFYKAKFEEDPTYEIPGYNLVPGATIREVTDWDAARTRLGEYLDIAQLNSAADYRLGELEKSLGKVLKLKGPQLRERMNAILAGLFTEKQNAGSLKRIKGKAKVEALV